MANSSTLSQYSAHLPPPMNLLLDPKSWYPSPHRVVERQTWLVPVILSSFIFSSLLPRRIRIWIATPALLLLLSQTRTYSTGKLNGDFGRATLIFWFVLKWIDYQMLLEDGEIWKVKRKTNPDEKRGWLEEKVEDDGLWQRFRYTIDLWIFNMRGINWSWRVNGIPDRSPQSKLYFLFRTLLRFVGTFIALDICKFLSAKFTYIHPQPRPQFFSQPILVQITLTWLHQLEAFVLFNLPYQTFAFLSVATDFQAQEDWPPLFGSLSESYLVSKAWGRTWHQLSRRPLGILTPHVQRLLGAKSRGMKRTTSVFCSFFMSGLAHWSGALNLPWTPSSHVMFTYFMMQAPVIRMEDYVVDLGKARGIKGNRMLRYLGYMWTFAWISFSMRYAAAFQFESGPLSNFQPLTFGLIRLVLAKIG